jgi:hypothetical protein
MAATQRTAKTEIQRIKDDLHEISGDLDVEHDFTKSPKTSELEIMIPEDQDVLGESQDALFAAGKLEIRIWRHRAYDEGVGLSTQTDATDGRVSVLVKQDHQLN